MFYLPRDSSLVNQTHRTADSCSNSTTEATAQFTDLGIFQQDVNSTVYIVLVVAMEDTSEVNYPFWHVVFWISPLFQAFFGGLTFTASCFIVSYATEPDEVDENLLIEIFQSPFYPQWLRNAFKIKTESKSDEKEDLMKIDSRHDEELAVE